MPLPSAQYVKNLSPTGEFANYTDGFVDGLIMDEVALHYGELTGEAEYLRLVALHTAHLLARMNMTGGGGLPGPQGPLLSVTTAVGSATKTWGQAQQGNVNEGGNDLDKSTEYGRRAIAMRDQIPTMRSARPG